MSIEPGAWIGFLGGGQLGRMAAMAAKAMGYRIAVLDPDPHCPLSALADRTVTASFEDLEAVEQFAASCQVVTFEREDIPIAAARAANRGSILRPEPGILELMQDRWLQKQWLARHGFPTASFTPWPGEQPAQSLFPGFLKTRQGGYDGRSQAEVAAPSSLVPAWNSLGGKSCILEAKVDFAMEISVLVARRPTGAMKVYPPAENRHHGRVLDWSVIPARIRPDLQAEAQSLGQRLAETLQLEGVMVVEMFVLSDGTLQVNEMAARIHNSYHASERACVTGQFEQFIRAICDLPLGQPDLVQPTAIANLLGDLWLPGPPDFVPALEKGGVRLHLYGKAQAFPGRKMGHFSSTAATADEAVTQVCLARGTLAQVRSAPPPEDVAS